jgi:hypothetical protein
MMYGLLPMSPFHTVGADGQETSMLMEPFIISRGTARIVLLALPKIALIVAERGLNELAEVADRFQKERWINTGKMPNRVGLCVYSYL